jgi:alpha-L-arabinofuranosidase
MVLEILSEISPLPWSEEAEIVSWANLRRKNTGRDEPHAVKYWGLGNEGTLMKYISTKADG